MKMNAEVKRRSGKLSYQGDSLERRINKQQRACQRAAARERKAKKALFTAQLSLMSAEDELSLLHAIRLKAYK
jgi:hypothetical protein